MDRGTERPTCPEEGRPESLSKNSWEEKKKKLTYMRQDWPGSGTDHTYSC